MSFALTVTFNPCLDVNISAPELTPDIKLRCSVPVVYPGGGGINVARAIRRLGGEAVAVFPAGGNTGAQLISLLEKEDIPVISVSLDGDTRQNLVVTDRSSGKQYRFVLPGPMMTTGCLEDLLGIVARQKRVEFLIVSGSLTPNMPGDVYRELKEIADRKKMKMVVDSSGPALKDAVRHGAYLIKPSVRELLSLYGEKDDRQLPRLARDLVRGGDCRVVVVSMGAKGALLVTRDMEEQIPAPVVEPVSTVGAGDSMVAGIVWGLHSGRSVAEAVRFGCVCGAAATLHPGTALFQRKDIESLNFGLTGRGYVSIPNETDAIK